MHPAVPSLLTCSSWPSSVNSGRQVLFPAHFTDPRGCDIYSLKMVTVACASSWPTQIARRCRRLLWQQVMLGGLCRLKREPSTSSSPALQRSEGVPRHHVVFSVFPNPICYLLDAQLLLLCRPCRAMLVLTWARIEMSQDEYKSLISKYEEDHPKQANRPKKERAPGELKRPQSAYFFFLADFRLQFKVGT